MKKIIALVMALTLVLAFAGCGAEDNTKKSEGVMTYAEYDAAAVDDAVVIETFVQNKQSWWDNKATLYTADPEGAYFIYNMTCSEEDYAKLTPGTKIKVTGYKAEWAGEKEIAEGATFEIESGNYIAPALDVTANLADEAFLLAHQNQFASFKGMTVEESNEGGDPFMYNWDGSGSQGDDLYFTVSADGKTYTFTVESYLCDKDSEVYKTVEGLKVGDVVDMEGFLYWYEGLNPHITSVVVK